MIYVIAMIGAREGFLGQQQPKHDKHTNERSEAGFLMRRLKLSAEMMRCVNGFIVDIKYGNVENIKEGGK